MIPAAGVEIYRVEKAALDLVSQQDGEKEIRGGRGWRLCGCQAGRGIVGWMAGAAADIDIVDVVGANACGVGERRPFERGPALGPDDGCRVASAREGELTHSADRPFLEGRNSAAQGVEQMHLRPLDRGGVEIGSAKRTAIVGKTPGERRFVGAGFPRGRSGLGQCGSRGDASKAGKKN